MDRMEPTRRPSGRCRGYQNWTNLSFLHWPIAVDALRPLIPESLEIDTFDGTAWVGVVPFFMSKVRPRMLPPVPGLSWFSETNVRTYVHYRGERPGVWFFSLDARNRIAVAIARWLWNLNYHYSQMSLAIEADSIVYQGQRKGGLAAYQIQVDLNLEGPDLWHATPGSLEHFLAERYLLYTLNKTGQLLCGQVHHSPYPLQRATTVMCEQGLTDVNGISIKGNPTNTLFSPGVNVQIFDLKPIE